MLKCKLKSKEIDKDVAKKEIRFESDTIDEGIAKLDELVVMDTMAYVLIKKREYVFLKGSVFSEPTSNKDYDFAFSLISPVSMAPMVLLLR